MPKAFDVSVPDTAIPLDNALPDAPVRASSVLVSAPASNTQDVLLGDADLQNQTLTPGGTPVAYPVQAFLRETYVRSVSGTQVLNCLYTLQQ